MLEIEDYDALISSLGNVNTQGMERGYFFIFMMETALASGECSETQYGQANKLYQERLKGTPADW